MNTYMRELIIRGILVKTKILFRAIDAKKAFTINFLQAKNHEYRIRHDKRTYS